MTNCHCIAGSQTDPKLTSPETWNVSTQTKPQDFEPQQPDISDMPSSPSSSPSSDDPSSKPSSSDYIPSSSESSDSMTDSDASSHTPLPTSLHKERKYMVFWSSLVTLLAWCCCPSCSSKKLHPTQSEVGTMLKLTLTCQDCERKFVWNSQPFIGNTPVGNMLLSASILFSGNIASKVMKLFSHMGCACISLRTFFRHQANVLLTAVNQVWCERQEWMFAHLQAEGEDLICGGDGRADSPGHSAKFGSYTMIELRKKCIIDIQLVQV